MNQIIKIDETKVSSHLGEMVRKAVEERLPSVVDAGTQKVCKWCGVPSFTMGAAAR